MYLLDDLPGRANSLLSTWKKLTKSLTCNNMVFALPAPAPASYLVKETLMSTPKEVKELPPTQDLPLLLVHVPKHTPCMLTGMLLMNLNAYFHPLSPALSLWTPV
ncbi:hypothetical protein DSO57_1006623 [Entomophthora muscae]|uniref:Uncharacterized protein n=1 Tax=Entomophthora muscae TaxID=34485 RepID=A0ACC2T7I3_9FUNG|nr:hypothetical protein DSO57_1006623 [Entomophthora muscae]